MKIIILTLLIIKMVVGVGDETESGLRTAQGLNSYRRWHAEFQKII